MRYGENAVVWVAGASSGLGLAAAKAFCRAGFRVIAGARSFSRGQEGPFGYALRLDVTQPESVSAFVRDASEKYGPPDILVNCAGILNLGACEKYSEEEMQRVIDTNFFGQVRMMQEVLPMMRTRGHGRIVCFSSINGVLGIPYQGIYTASKHALEGFCESLAAEVRPFGVEIMLLEPGDHRGGSDAYRAHAGAMEGDTVYGAPYARTVEKIRQDEHHGSDPDRLGDALVRTVCRGHLPLRRCVASPGQHLAVLLHRVMRSGHFNRLISLYYGANRR